MYRDNYLIIELERVREEKKTVTYNYYQFYGIIFSANYMKYGRPNLIKKINILRYYR